MLKKKLYAHAATNTTNATTTIAATQAKGIKVEFPRNI